MGLVWFALGIPWDQLVIDIGRTTVMPCIDLIGLIPREVKEGALR